MSDDEGAFVRAFRMEMNAAQREFWEDNTAQLLAYGRGSWLPSREDRAEAQRRVGRLSDEELSRATHAVAEADAARCSECGRDYE